MPSPGAKKHPFWRLVPGPAVQFCGFETVDQRAHFDYYEYGPNDIDPENTSNPHAGSCSCLVRTPGNTYYSAECRKKFTAVEITFDFWVYYTALPLTPSRPWYGFAAIGSHYSNAEEYWHFCHEGAIGIAHLGIIKIGATYYWHFIVRGTPSSETFDIADGDPAGTDYWRHIVIKCRDGADGFIKLYVDDELLAEWEGNPTRTPDAVFLGYCPGIYPYVQRNAVDFYFDDVSITIEE